jgi:hypothetical protein
VELKEECDIANSCNSINHNIDISFNNFPSVFSSETQSSLTPHTSQKSNPQSSLTPHTSLKSNYEYENNVQSANKKDSQNTNHNHTQNINDSQISSSSPNLNKKYITTISSTQKPKFNYQHSYKIITIDQNSLQLDKNCNKQKVDNNLDLINTYIISEHAPS